MAIRALENRHQDFFGGAGISGAFENDQLASAQMWGNRFSGGRDVAEVRLVVLVQRSGNTDDDGVHARDVGVIGGRGEALGARRLDLGGRNPVDVGPAGLKHVDLPLVDVEAGDGELLFAEQQRQRQADIAHSNHANFSGAGLDLAFEQFRQFGACSFRWQRHSKFLGYRYKPFRSSFYGSALQALPHGMLPVEGYALIVFAADRSRYQTTVRFRPSSKSISGL